MGIQASRFSDIMDTPSGKEKLAQAAEPYIRDKLREDSWMAQLIPPEDVSAADCTPATTHDGLMKIVHVEPSTSGAAPVTFRGGTEAEWVRGPRIGVPFYSIMSRMFEKTTQELLAYEMPLTKIIEKFAVKDIESIYDYQGIRYIESGVQMMQNIANAGATALASSNVQAGAVIERSIAKGQGARISLVDDLVLHPLVRSDFTRLMNMLDGYERKAHAILITAPDYNDLMNWTSLDAGDSRESDTMEKGLNLNTLFGLKVVKTIKTRILRTGNVYAFCAPEFLGKFFILNKINFWTNKIINKIQFCAWGDIAMAIINIASEAKLELYSANVEPATGAANDIAAKTPVTLATLSERYNRVDEGFVYSGVHTY